MSIAFVHFGCIFTLYTASDIALSICNGVGGCLCPISSNIILMYMAAREMMYSATTSAYVADGILCLIMCVALRILLLFWVIVSSWDKKKSPPTRLLAFYLLR